MQIGESWLYSDLVHADPKGEKAQALKLSYRDRYYAGTSFFSMLSIIIVKMLNFISFVSKHFHLDIDENAWKEHVVASEEDSEVAAETLVALPPNVEVPVGIDPITLPGAVDMTSVTEAIRFLHPNRKADVVFLHGEEVVDRVHGACSWKNDLLTILIADALTIELSVVNAKRAQTLRRVETDIKSRFTSNEIAVKSLRTIMQKSDKLIVFIPYEEGKALC